jgi:DNA-binding winged helix-turn-helix (wHTH) protein
MAYFILTLGFIFRGGRSPSCGLLECNLLYRFEKYVLDTDRRELRQGDDLVPLAPQVFDILVYLIRHRERVISKEDLIADVWGGRVVSESALTTRLNGVRKAIGDSGEEQRLIKTLPRKGFRFVGDIREGPQPTNTPTREMPTTILVSHEQPSIIVLPFANLSGDPLKDYFTDGVVEDITTEL